jgi:hypothetical protein
VGKELYRPSIEPVSIVAEAMAHLLIVVKLAHDCALALAAKCPVGKPLLVDAAVVLAPFVPEAEEAALLLGGILRWPKVPTPIGARANTKGTACRVLTLQRPGLVAIAPVGLILQRMHRHAVETAARRV